MAYTLVYIFIFGNGIVYVNCLVISIDNYITKRIETFKQKNIETLIPQTPIDKRNI